MHSKNIKDSEIPGIQPIDNLQLTLESRKMLWFDRTLKELICKDTCKPYFILDNLAIESTLYRLFQNDYQTYLTSMSAVVRYICGFRGSSDATIISWWPFNVWTLKGSEMNYLSTLSNRESRWCKWEIQGVDDGWLKENHLIWPPFNRRVVADWRQLESVWGAWFWLCNQGKDNGIIDAFF